MSDPIEEQALELWNKLGTVTVRRSVEVIEEELRKAEARGIERAAQKAEIHDPDIARRIRALAAEPEPELRLNGRHGTTVDIDALIEKEREDPEFRKAYDALATEPKSE